MRVIMESRMEVLWNDPTVSVLPSDVGCDARFCGLEEHWHFHLLFTLFQCISVDGGLCKNLKIREETVSMISSAGSQNFCLSHLKVSGLISAVPSVSVSSHVSCQNKNPSSFISCPG